MAVFDSRTTASSCSSARVGVAALLRQAGEQRQGALVAHRLRHQRHRPIEHLARLILGAAGEQRAAGGELHVVLAGVRVGDPDQRRDGFRVVAAHLRQLGLDGRQRRLRALEARVEEPVERRLQVGEIDAEGVLDGGVLRLAAAP
jgi:hypothetical protein